METTIGKKLLATKATKLWPLQCRVSQLTGRTVFSVNGMRTIWASFDRTGPVTLEEHESFHAPMQANRVRMIAAFNSNDICCNPGNFSRTSTHSTRLKLSIYIGLQAVHKWTALDKREGMRKLQLVVEPNCYSGGLSSNQASFFAISLIFAHAWGSFLYLLIIRWWNYAVFHLIVINHGTFLNKIPTESLTDG